MNGQINPQRGSALFVLLFSLVILGGVVHRLTAYATHYAKLAATYHSGVVARERIRSGLAATRSARRSCVESRVDSGDGVYRTVSTCTSGEPPFRLEPTGPDFVGRPDYGALFDRVTPCPTALQPESLRNFTSPISPDRCLIPLLTSDTTMTHNIQAESIELKARTTAARIATPGELVVRNTVKTDVDVLIVAGGTIRIPVITTASKAVIRVTLLSAHGDIEVHTVSPNISLLSIGRRLIVVPPSTAATGHPLPPMTSAGISGIVL